MAMKKCIILIACLTVSLHAGAQTLGFLQIPDDAAISAMAGAGVAVQSSSPIDNNLADAALGSKTLSVAAGYTMWQPKVASYGLVSASASYRVIPKLVVAVSFKDFMSPAYTLTSATGQAEGSFKPMEMAISAGAAYQISDALSVGVAAKFLNSSLGESAKASTVAANVSLKYAANGFQAGLAANNLGGKVSYGGASYSLPTMVKAGGAYTISGFTAALEADYVMAAGFMAAIGAQYSIKDIVFVRAGYHLGASDKVIPSHVSLGLGVQFAGVHLDVSFLTASQTLGNTLAFGLGYAF